MNKIQMNLGPNSYDIYCGKDTVKRLPVIIKNKYSSSQILLIVDNNISEYYKKEIEELTARIDNKVYIYIYSASENKKNLKEVNKIYEYLVDKKFDRNSLIIAIGGGITGDLAGFTASSYMRGIDFIQVPTTLLSAIDSSLGGKTGINFNKVKNIIGAFYQPKAVFIDLSFFKTLPVEELVCGIGELIKYAYITDNKTFKFIYNNLEKIFDLDEKVLNKIIQISVGFKSSVVQFDEKENGVRKILNLGHTFGHAIETEQNYKIKHGQAVVIGICCALYLANYKNLISDKDLEKLLTLPLKLRPYIKVNLFNTGRIIELMKVDKKNSNQKINFVVPIKPGEVILDLNANFDEIKYSVQNGIGLFV